MKSYQEFFAELSRRKVFKVAAVYGAASFGLLQLADLIKDGFGLPDTFIPFVTAMVLLGFPLALILAWALEVTPDGVRKTEPAAVDELAAIVSQPASKRWPAGLLAVAGFALLVGGVWIAGQRTGAETALAGSSDRAGAEVRLAMTDLSEDPRPSIAVLPFADMSPDGDQEYFSDGITEEILNVLAKVSELRVTARTSAFAFKGRDQDLRAVGDSLGVRYIVEGSVRKAGDQLRITSQLIDTADGSHIWSESYNEALTAANVFDIQTRIAGSISNALRVPLGIDDPADLVTPTADLEAYDLYLAGRTLIRKRGASLREAVQLFEAAIARDSAWAGLAEAKELQTWYPDSWDGGPPEDRSQEPVLEAELQEEAERAARRALELDPDVASARVALGSVYRYRFDWSEAEAEYLQALEVDPDNAEAFHQYSELLANVGRIAESVRTARRAVALDPSPIKLGILATTLDADGQPGEAIRVLERAIALDEDGSVPQLKSLWYFLTLEVERYEDMFRHAPEHVVDARAAIEAAVRSGDMDGVPPRLRESTLWMKVGQPDSAAAAFLEDMEDEPGFKGWIWIPLFDPIRDHPDYVKGLRLVNLEGRTAQRTPR